MNIPNIKDLVKEGKLATFVRFQNNELWYQCDGFEFPVSIADTGNGIFLAEDKTIFFMRWINARIKELKGYVILKEEETKS